MTYKDYYSPGITDKISLEWCVFREEWGHKSGTRPTVNYSVEPICQLPIINWQNRKTDPRPETPLKKWEIIIMVKPDPLIKQRSNIGSSMLSTKWQLAGWAITGFKRIDKGCDPINLEMNGASFQRCTPRMPSSLEKRKDVNRIRKSSGQNWKKIERNKRRVGKHLIEKGAKMLPKISSLYKNYCLLTLPPSSTVFYWEPDWKYI